MAFFELVSAHATPGQSSSAQVGREVATPVHLQDGDEFKLPLPQLIDYGGQLFTAKCTVQKGAGRGRFHSPVR